MSRSEPRATVQPLSPERYRVQFTIGQETRDLLSEVQSLLCREFLDGDAGAIFERALRLLHKEVRAARFGKAEKPAKAEKQGKGAYEKRIRPGADKVHGARSRHIPNAVKRAVWYRDGGQCAFVSKEGHRCAERRFLELHHLLPYALDGPGTVGNIALRCRRHNAYEAETVFGARRPLKAAATVP